MLAYLLIAAGAASFGFIVSACLSMGKVAALLGELADARGEIDALRERNAQLVGARRTQDCSPDLVHGGSGDHG